MSARSSHHTPPRAIPIASPIAGPIAGLIAILIGCSGDARSDRRENAVEARVRGELALVLDLQIQSVSCPGCAAPGNRCQCRVEVRGAEAFEVDLLGTDEQGELALKPHGNKKFEYQVAKGFRDRLRVDVGSIACPRGGDVGAGFTCQVVVADHDEPITVRISAAPRPDRFIWEAIGVLMPARIEKQVQAHLGSHGREARVDCGRTLRRSVPDSTFACAVRYADGTASEVEARVIDTKGNVKINYFQGETFLRIPR